MASLAKIRAIRLGEGHTSGHRYNEDDLRIHLNIKDAPGEVRKRYTILYARVSSPKQKAAGDLDRQIELLKQEFPNHDKVISDVASGLNFKRKGLITLLDLVEKGHVADVVVSYRDRLARFGVDLIERTFKKHGTTLHVVSSEANPPSSEGTDYNELAEDLLAVCNFFVAKNNGKRAAALRRSRQSRQLESSEDEDASRSSESDEDQTPSPKRQRSQKAQTNPRDCSLDL